jgi:hypothetical protein
MRITISRMHGSLAHKVGSGQAVSRPDNFGEAHTWKKCQKYRQRRQLGVYWSVAEMQNGNPGNMNPTAAGNFQRRAGHPNWAGHTSKPVANVG